jgi:Flp pilus assembly protein TadD
MPRFISPEESVEYGRRGTEHAESGNFDDAEFWFRRILGSWPGYGAGYADLGQLSLARADAEDDDDARRGHRERAEELFREALASGPAFGGVRVPLARTLALLGREAEARELLRELSRDDNVAETHRAAGRDLQADIEGGKGLFSRATEQVRRLVLQPPRHELAPDDKRRLHAARDLLREATARQSTFASEWFLGKTELRLGQFEAAAEAFERACALDPQQADGQRELESAYLELGRNLEALQAAERALALRPTDSTLRCNLAFVLVLTGDLKRARDEATRAAAEAPTDVVARNIIKLMDDVSAGRRKRPETLAEAEGRKAR